MGCPGMHKAQQAAAAASVVPRQAQERRAPSRFSRRVKVNRACRAVLNLTVRALAAGVAVTATLAGAFEPMDQTQLDT
eukprot:7386688-Prymnesium_polylepis.2